MSFELTQPLVTETTTIAERRPGDLLAIVEKGQIVCVDLGALFGVRYRKGKPTGEPQSALVTTIDPHTHKRDSRTTRCVSPDCRVIDVIDTLIWRKERLLINAPAWRRETLHDVDVDPMLGRPKPGGTW